LRNFEFHYEIEKIHLFYRERLSESFGVPLVGCH